MRSYRITIIQPLNQASAIKPLNTQVRNPTYLGLNRSYQKVSDTLNNYLKKPGSELVIESHFNSGETSSMTESKVLQATSIAP